MPSAEDGVLADPLCRVASDPVSGKAVPLTLNAATTFRSTVSAVSPLRAKGWVKAEADPFFAAWDVTAATELDRLAIDDSVISTLICRRASAACSCTLLGAVLAVWAAVAPGAAGRAACWPDVDGAFAAALFDPVPVADDGRASSADPDCVPEAAGAAVAAVDEEPADADPDADGLAFPEPVLAAVEESWASMRLALSDEELLDGVEPAPLLDATGEPVPPPAGGVADGGALEVAASPAGLPEVAALPVPPFAAGVGEALESAVRAVGVADDASAPPEPVLEGAGSAAGALPDEALLDGVAAAAAAPDGGASDGEPPGEAGEDDDPEPLPAVGAGDAPVPAPGPAVAVENAVVLAAAPAGAAADGP